MVHKPLTLRVSSVVLFIYFFLKSATELMVYEPRIGHGPTALSMLAEKMPLKINFV